MTVLGYRPGPVVSVRVLDLSGSGMRLRSNLPVPCGMSVNVESNNLVARGEVCRCEPERDSYTLGIQVFNIYIK